jgi:hypothetical protein
LAQRAGGVLSQSATRVHSAAAQAPNSSYFSNTCAKYSRYRRWANARGVRIFFAFFKCSLLHSRSSYEFVVFLEHVCKVHALEHRIRRISRTRVQGAAAGSPNSSYFSNTCATCRRSSYEFVVFLEHVCKESPLEIRIRCISRTRAQSAASQQARHIEVLDFRNSGLGSRSFNT